MSNASASTYHWETNWNILDQIRGQRRFTYRSRKLANFYLLEILLTHCTCSICPSGVCCRLALVLQLHFYSAVLSQLLVVKWFFTTIYHNLPQYTTIYHNIPQSTIIYHNLPQSTTIYHEVSQDDHYNCNRISLTRHIVWILIKLWDQLSAGSKESEVAEASVS